MILYTFSIYLDFNNYQRHKAPCTFDPTLPWAELCHLQHNTETNKHIIQKHLGCSKKESELLVNLPLINVVPGSRFWNGTDHLSHKVGTYQDITFISDKVIRASIDTIIEYIHHFNNPQALLRLKEWLEATDALRKITLEERPQAFTKIHEAYKSLF